MVEWSAFECVNHVPLLSHLSLGGAWLARNLVPAIFAVAAEERKSLLRRASEVFYALLK